MSDTYHFAALVTLAAGVGLAALLSNRLTEKIRVPAPLLVFVAAAIAVKAIPSLHQPNELTVERLVTIALVLVLFDGGMHVGWSKFRSALVPIAAVGVLGTFLTAAAAGVFIHLAFNLSWFVSLLIATAISPTDPAVVFSVLGQREVAGRSGTILEGESGANDPVGIALMASLISAGHLNSGAFLHVTGEFLLQMGVGALIGVCGGWTMLWFMRKVRLPSEGLYPLRSAACAFVIFGVATVAHGSGFLAVFVAGILHGDVQAPYKIEVDRFHSALASLGEIVAFVILGLTVDVNELRHGDVWAAGVTVAVVLAFVIRPVVVGLCLIPARLKHNELAFVAFAGLKGAVPILLGTFILTASVAHSQRAYGIVVVIVVFSVLIQGSLVPTVARTLHLPMHAVEPTPWALGVRLRDEPDDVHYLTVAANSPVIGTPISESTRLPKGSRISVVVREGRLLRFDNSDQLEVGDEVMVIAPPEFGEDLANMFAHRVNGLGS